MTLSESNRGESPPFEEHPASGRNPDGTFAPGNVAALTHGAHSRQVREAERPEQAPTRAQLATKRAAILEDLGGEAKVSQLQRDLVDRYLELDTVASWLGGNLIAVGPLTAKGRTRAALSAYVTTVDRVHRLAAALGLGRRAKQVALPDYLAQAYGDTPTEGESSSGHGSS